MKMIPHLLTIAWSDLRINRLWRKYLKEKKDRVGGERDGKTGVCAGSPCFPFPFFHDVTVMTTK